MSYRQHIRTVTGGLTVIVLLALIILDTTNSSINLSLEDKALLTSMIAALLGVDLAINQLPIDLQGGNDE